MRDAKNALAMHYRYAHDADTPWTVPRLAKHSSTMGSHIVYRCDMVHGMIVLKH